MADLIETMGLDEEIRCAMCTNPKHNENGCDGACQYDERLYRKIISILEERITAEGADDGFA